MLGLCLLFCFNLVSQRVLVLQTLVVLYCVYRQLVLESVPWSLS